MGLVKTELEKVKEEKEGVEFKLAKFEKSSKDLDDLLASLVTNKSKKGFGYNAVPSPHPLILNRPTPLDLSYSGLEEFQQPEINWYGPRDSSSKPTTVCNRESNNSKENIDDSLTQQPKSVTETSSVVPTLKVDTKWKEKFFNHANNVRLEEPKRLREHTLMPPIIEDWCPDDRKEVVVYQKSVNTGLPVRLLDVQRFDGGYVTFGGGANGGKNPPGKEKKVSREIQCRQGLPTKGVAERKNRTLIEAARTMLADSKLPTTFWAEAVSTACYVVQEDGVSLVRGVLGQGFWVAKGEEVSLVDIRIWLQNGLLGFTTIRTRDRFSEWWMVVCFRDVVVGYTRSSDQAYLSTRSNCIFSRFWEDASYFEDDSLKSVDDANTIQDGLILSCGGRERKLSRWETFKSQKVVRHTALFNSMIDDITLEASTKKACSEMRYFEKLYEEISFQIVPMENSLLLW
ncbi:ribonuclease H-like domain-containing protein [Tanacetum coccineum]